jgi:hypothetical protein
MKLAEPYIPSELVEVSICKNCKRRIHRKPGASAWYHFGSEDVIPTRHGEQKCPKEQS